MAVNLIPTSTGIQELRKLFIEKLNCDGPPATCDGGFHANDLHRVRTVDIWLQRFLEQNDLDMKKSLKQLWDTCEWRKTFGTNDISESNINMNYVNDGLSFPRNHDIEGKPMLIYRSILHVRGKRDSKELIRIFVYWMERLHRDNNFDLVTIFFDLANCGVKNLDLDYTINIVNILKAYYPNAINYILIYEMPWVFAAGIKIIKSLLPPKAVSTMKFIDSKNIREYVSEDCMLTCWGGTDDYTFRFLPESPIPNKQLVLTAHIHYTELVSIYSVFIKAGEVIFVNRKSMDDLKKIGIVANTRDPGRCWVLFVGSGNEIRTCPSSSRSSNTISLNNTIFTNIITKYNPSTQRPDNNFNSRHT